MAEVALAHPKQAPQDAQARTRGGVEMSERVEQKGPET